MKNQNKIKDQKQQYDIDRRAAKIQYYFQVKLVSMNILIVQKYHLLIKEE